jgi:hopanoid biosynthesis associated protein HpnK
VSNLAERRVIVTADDFGLALPVNEAVELAHREGILGGASLMVGADAAEDAVRRARRLPRLRVGLHVVLVDGRPLLAPERIPDLVDEDGQFDRRLVRAGIRFFLLPRVRRQLENEIRAQFEAFRATGLALDHVNAHRHMHLHPTVLAMILRIGRDYGLKGVRIPYEPLRIVRRIVGPSPWPAYIGNVLLQPWVGLLRRRVRRAGMRCNQFVFGLSRSGEMTEDTVLRLIECLPAGTSEIYFHPATAAHAALPAAGRHQAELGALVSPRVRAAFAAAQIQAISFSEL